jgi:hypothetical protein
MPILRSVLIQALIISAALIVIVAAQQIQPWLHIQIEDQEDENSEINLPIALLEVMLSMRPEQVVSDGQIKIGKEHSISIRLLREMWQKTLNANNAETITSQEINRVVTITKSNELIEIWIEETDGTVQASFPTVLINALLSGESENLAIAPAIAALKNLRGDIINIRENNRKIRVWIDEVAQ